jgi:flagellar biogenesis protein FliO
MLEILGMLLLVAGLAFVFLKLLGMLGNRHQEEKLQILAQRQLEPRRRLFVVALDERAWLLSSSEAGIQCIAELSPHDIARLKAPSSASARADKLPCTPAPDPQEAEHEVTP